jgi:hypothetical protein
MKLKSQIETNSKSMIAIKMGALTGLNLLKYVQRMRIIKNGFTIWVL